MKNHRENLVNKRLNSSIEAFIKRSNTNTASLLAEVFGDNKNMRQVKEYVVLNRINDLLPLMDEHALKKILIAPQCPDILGVLIARHGSENLQNAYLFGDNHLDSDAIEALVMSRPANIKNIFLQRGVLGVVAPLLQYDSHSFLLWANELGYGKALDQNESWHISDVKRAFSFWEEENLHSSKREMEERCLSSAGKYKGTIQMAIIEALAQMGYDYHHNGWSNDYGFLSKDIKEWLLHKTHGVKSKFLRMSIRIDASILSAKNGSPFHHFEFDVSNALMRMDSVVAAWFMNHPDPIFLSQS